MKRLSIAIHLLTEPSVLMLDEPTTGNGHPSTTSPGLVLLMLVFSCAFFFFFFFGPGLDSSMSQDVITVVKRVAQRGNRTVMCTIHQPGAKLFGMFDQCVLLAEGRTLYFGPVETVIRYFEGVVRDPMPRKSNPAETLCMHHHFLVLLLLLLVLVLVLVLLISHVIHPVHVVVISGGTGSSSSQKSSELATAYESSDLGRSNQSMTEEYKKPPSIRASVQATFVEPPQAASVWFASWVSPMEELSAFLCLGCLLMSWLALLFPFRSSCDDS